MIFFYVSKKSLEIHKSFWATMKNLWNRKKVNNIPLLLVNNELITEFEAKANIFNKYFASQIHWNQ